MYWVSGTAPPSRCWGHPDKQPKSPYLDRLRRPRTTSCQLAQDHRRNLFELKMNRKVTSETQKITPGSCFQFPDASWGAHTHTHREGRPLFQLPPSSPSCPAPSELLPQHILGILFHPGLVCSFKECWSGLPFPSLGDLPDPGIEPTSAASPVLQVDSSPAEP